MLTEPWSVLEHAITPLLVVVDYLVVGRTRGRAWWPFTWTVLPLAYLVYYVYGDVLLYDFLDPYGPDYQATVAGLLVATVVIGCLLYAADRWSSLLIAGRAGCASNRVETLVLRRQSSYDRDIS